jgi:hypothetical protein
MGPRSPRAPSGDGRGMNPQNHLKKLFQVIKLIDII